MSGAPKVDRDGYWENGWTIVRNVYSPAEIAELRQGVIDSLGQGPGDLLANPRLRRVLTDGRLVDIARQILGQQEIVYAGDSSFSFNAPGRGYHKDNADRFDAKAPDWRGPYTILRFGLYLQDHYRHSGGLNLREKSHNGPSNQFGKNIYVRTRAGDVGVWSLRTTHSGNAMLLKFPKSIHPKPGAMDKYAKWIEAKRDGDRIALFAALGLDDAHHQRYIDYLKTRAYMVRSWNASIYDEETLAEADKAGLIVRDIRSEIQGDETVGQNEGWAALPY
jgi:hypothetical protein